MSAYQTLGNMTNASNQLVYPSTLSYGERSKLDAVEYARVYHTNARDEDVFQRLQLDAAARKQLPSRQFTYAEGTTASSAGAHGRSQSVSLRKMLQVPDDSTIDDAPLDKLHPSELEAYRRKDPVQFFKIIRPQCETTTQTLRMLGTYPTDAPCIQSCQPTGSSS